MCRDCISLWWHRGVSDLCPKGCCRKLGAGDRPYTVKLLPHVRSAGALVQRRGAEVALARLRKAFKRRFCLFCFKVEICVVGVRPWKVERDMCVCAMCTCACLCVFSGGVQRGTDMSDAQRKCSLQARGVRMGSGREGAICMLY